jgi:hypothetical protein
MNLKLKLKTGIFACPLLVSSAVMAQKTAVTGTVKDHSGEVLPGVSIRVERINCSQILNLKL